MKKEILLELYQKSYWYFVFNFTFSNKTITECLNDMYFNKFFNRYEYLLILSDWHSSFDTFWCPFDDYQKRVEFLENRIQQLK